MDSIEVRKREISAILGGIEDLTRGLFAMGVDPRDPGDREAYDIVCRIERKMVASLSNPKKVLHG
jgi:hypothetical protein